MQGINYYSRDKLKGDLFDKQFENKIKACMANFDDFKSESKVHPLAKDNMGCCATEEAMQDAVRSFKSNKSYGIDGLPAEILKS